MASTMDAAQALLTAFDTSMSKHWREEDRRWRLEDREWRGEDMTYREFEKAKLEEEMEMREQEKIWREEDMEQRHVDNARYLWARFVEKNRRDVEEKSEQLKAISNLAALFAGFAVVTLTQFAFEYTNNPTWIITCFGVLTAISICLHTIAMVMCTLILGSILKNGKSYVDEAAEEDFMFRCRAFIETYQIGARPPAPRRTFEAFWEYRCEADWRLAFTLFTWGVFSFLLELIPIGWIKFYYSAGTASAFMAICIASIIVWAWQQCSWGSYLTNRNDVSATNTANSFHCVPVGLPFDWHIAPEGPLRRAESVPSPGEESFGNESSPEETQSTPIGHSEATGGGDNFEVPEGFSRRNTSERSNMQSRMESVTETRYRGLRQSQGHFRQSEREVEDSNFMTDNEDLTSPSPVPYRGKRKETESSIGGIMHSGEFVLDEQQMILSPTSFERGVRRPS